jgi:hypothetical protein
VTEKQLSLNISSQKKLRQSPPQNETLAAVTIPYRGEVLGTTIRHDADPR